MGDGFCRCDSCLQSFRNKYGRELPRTSLDKDLDYQRYRQDCFVKPFAAIRAAIDAESPTTAFVGGVGYTYYFGRQGDNARRVAPHVDVVSIESQWNYDLPRGYAPDSAPRLHEVGMIMRQLRSSCDKPVLGTVWIAKHVDQNFAPRTKPHVVLNFMELLAHGAIPQVHVQNALEVDATHLPTLTRLYADAGKLLPWLADSYPVAHVGILDWGSLDRPTTFFDMSLRGAYKAMLEEHIPIEFVGPAEVSKTKCNVLLLANAGELPTDCIDEIEDFVRRGGGLVATYQTTLQNPRLAALAGIKHLGSVNKVREFPLHSYYRISDQTSPWDGVSGALRSFQGKFERVETLEGTRVLGHVLDFAANRQSSKHILHVAWPGQPIAPLATERSIDKGKVIYVAADLCAAAQRFGDADSLKILATCVRAASTCKLPFHTSNVPPSVEVTLHRGTRGLAMVLINQTTNQYLSDPIRYIVPVHDLRFCLSCGPQIVRSITTISGGDVAWRQHGEEVDIRIEKIDDYEGLLIE